MASGSTMKRIRPLFFFLFASSSSKESSNMIFHLAFSRLGLCGLLLFFFLHLLAQSLRLVHPLIGLGGVLHLLGLVNLQLGLLAVQKVVVDHGLEVLGIDPERLLHARQSLVDALLALRGRDRHVLAVEGGVPLV